MWKITEDSYIRKDGIYPNLLDYFPKNIVDRFHKIGNDIETLGEIEEKYHNLTNCKSKILTI